MPYVTKLNRSVIKQRNKDQLETLKSENAKKAKKLKKLKLETLKLQEQDKFIKNTLKKYNKPKPKKKSIWDVIELPKANLI